MTREIARMATTAAHLARGIDQQVVVLECVRGRSLFQFADGSSAVAEVGDLTLLLLAALGNDAYRGARRGVRRLLESAGGGEGAAELVVSAGEVRVLLKTPKGTTAHSLTIDRTRLDGRYPTHEFASPPGPRLTSRAAGRALAPLPAHVFQERAGRILAALRRDDREELFSLPPLMVVMGLTDRCNHRCGFCFRQRDPTYRPSDGGVFTDANVTCALLDLAECGVRALRLCGEGEDSLHPHYMKYLLLARATGMGVMQITNGTHLRPLAPLVARCVRFLRVSVNGWTPEQYARSHGLRSADAFGEVVDALRAVNAFNGPTTCVSTVVTDDGFEPDAFERLMAATGAHLAVLKEDRECSRASDGGLVRLAVHGGARAAAGHRKATPGSWGFESLRVACRTRRPDALATPDGPLFEPPDWIASLGLGCVLRYLRAELERLEMYNCSLLHDFYGDLRSTPAAAAWDSPGRRAGVALDARRSPVLCPSCGWGDLFRLMNHYFDRDISQHGVPGPIHPSGEVTS